MGEGRGWGGGEVGGGRGKVAVSPSVSPTPSHTPLPAVPRPALVGAHGARTRSGACPLSDPPSLRGAIQSDEQRVWPPCLPPPPPPPQASTDYGGFLANEPTLSTTTIVEAATRKLVDEFQYLRCQVGGGGEEPRPGARAHPLSPPARLLM